MKCPYCKENMGDKTDLLFCPICGHKLERCPSCGCLLTKKIKFCPVDGTAIPNEIYNKLPDVDPNMPISGGKTKSKGLKIVFSILALALFLCTVGIGIFMIVNDKLPIKNSRNTEQAWVKEDDDIKSKVLSKIENESLIMKEDDNSGNVLLEEADLSENVQEVEISSNESSLTEDTVIDLNESNDTEETNNDVEEEEEDNEPNNGIAIEYEEITMDHIKSVIATSELVEKKVTHSKERIIDGDLTKAWVEGVSGQGIGESVSLNFDCIYKISGLSINAGYQKNKDLYEKNSRPKQITVEFSDESSQTFELEDKYAAQVLLLDVPVNSEYVKITIDSVYAGSKYKDTCISELSIF